MVVTLSKMNILQSQLSQSNKKVMSLRVNDYFVFHSSLRRIIVADDVFQN